jgi:hypothetical protein
VSSKTGRKNGSQGEANLNKPPDKRPFRPTLEALGLITLIFGYMASSSSHNILAFWIYAVAAILSAFGLPLPKIIAPVVTILAIVAAGWFSKESLSNDRRTIARRDHLTADAKPRPATPSASSTPPVTVDSLTIPVFTDAATETVTFSLGEHGILTRRRITELGKPSRWAPVEGMPEFILYIADKTFYADANLVGNVTIQHGKLLNKPNGWDANMDKGAIEVVDERSNPVYQIEYITAGRIVFRGVFPSTSDTSRWMVDKTAVRINGDPPNAPEPPKRMFKYPSKDFRGERENPK